MSIMRLAAVLCVGLAAVLVSVPVSGKVLDIPNFASPPTGGEYYIDPIVPGEGSNLQGPPVLTYGATSVPDGTTNCLKMTWLPIDPYLDARAGWRLRFGTDPNLVNHILSLSINPPGGILNNNFVGIFSATIDILDVNLVSCGAWDFNTDMAGKIIPKNDPLAQGFSSLVNNVMNTVTINLGNGPVPGSATVSGVDPLTGPFNYTAPNGIFPGNGNLANAFSIDFYENGNLRGNWVIPGQLGFIGDINFWDHVSITPEPATISLLALGALALVSRRRAR